MHAIFLLIHILVAVALVAVVLVQKSEGGGLGIGGGGGMSGFMTGRSTANLLTRTTSILFACFLGTSIVLAVLAARQHDATRSLFDQAPVSAPLPASSSAPKAPAQPVAPKGPSVPLAQ